MDLRIEEFKKKYISKVLLALLGGVIGLCFFFYKKAYDTTNIYLLSVANHNVELTKAQAATTECEQRRLDETTKNYNNLMQVIASANSDLLKIQNERKKTQKELSQIKE